MIFKTLKICLSTPKEMEKPDFLQMAVDRGLVLAAPDAAEMCEHVWNTHVVDRDAKIERLESENKRLSAILSISDDLANGRDEVIVSSGLRIIEIESENKALQEKLKISDHLK